MHSIARVERAISDLRLPGTIRAFEASTATAPDAAAAVGCAPGQIVKSLFFLADGRPTLVLVAGDRHADTAAIAEILGIARKKLKMGTPEQVREYTGFSVGAVSPIGLLQACDVVIDDSLRRFDDVWIAAGAPNALFSAATEVLVRVTSGQLATVTKVAP